MSTTSKKIKTFSVSSLKKLVSKHAKRVQSAKKISGTSRHTRQSNPDRHNSLSENPKVLM